MTSAVRNIITGIIFLAVVAVGLFFLILHSNYSLPLAYLLIAASIGIVIAYSNILPVYAVLFFTIPLSVELETGFGDSKIVLPSEALVAILFIAGIYRLLFIKGVRKKVLSHPVTKAVGVYLMVMLITALVSSDFLVSFKYLLVNISYTGVFFLFAIELSQKERAPRVLYFSYISALAVVVFIALKTHSIYGFPPQVSGWVVQPFFSDHTIYSACLGLILPVLFLLVFSKNILTAGILVKTGLFLLLIVFCAGLYFSFGRAAWISVAAVVLFYWLLQLKVRPWMMGIGFIVLCGLAYFNSDAYLVQFKQNPYKSTKRSPTLEEQTMSVTNISSDVSNAERINRWSCAWRMFLDKPLTGYGPGTYQFRYFDFQRADEMTPISVTSPYNNTFGRGGSAHSEYLLALSEMGFPGFISYVVMIILVIRSGMNAFYGLANKKERAIVLAALLSFFTYVVHTLFNNYLNNSKAASLFWLAAAIIVFYDLKRKQVDNPDSITKD